MKARYKVLLTIFALLVAFGFWAIDSPDTIPFRQSDYYRTMGSRLDSLSKLDYDVYGDTLKIGWAKINLTPDYNTTLAGYGKGAYSAVEDSIWVRAFAFDNGRQRIGLVAPDLLVFPPLVKKQIDDRLKEIGFDAIVYTATHTHHSLGNWHPGAVGRIFAGSYNEAVVEWIVTKCMQSLQAANDKKAIAKIAYVAVDGKNLVYNRLVGDNGQVDPWIRLLFMEQETGETAVLSTFSAHATTVSRNSTQLHRDYPGQLVDELEALDNIDFAAFAAGAVASHAPVGSGTDNTHFIAKSIADQVAQVADLPVPQYTNVLAYLSLAVELDQPQWRVSEEMIIRPWLFDKLFGEYAASISALRIGENLIIGTPCDFSGELMPPLDSAARALNLNLMINSFNGEYIGYITKDSHYDLNKYETRTMNWFGPENGQYFSEMIARVMKLASSW